MSDAETIGKPVGGDLREGKATLPVLYLLEKGISQASDILARRASEPSDITQMRDLVTLYGADNASRLEIQRRCENAVKALSVLPVSPARLALEDLAMRETERVI